MKTNIRQKDIFLESEADAWFERNREACSRQDFSVDATSTAVIEVARLQNPGGSPVRILEVGCGEGRRLAWLGQQIKADVRGIEPSPKAVAEAIRRGVSATQGTADVLPYESGSFDILVFGFCLYLCDRQDLFRIAQEADRVLKPRSWLVIHDFFSPAPMSRAYHHRPGVFPNKMDFRRLFDWHPAYTCYAHRLAHHATGEFCDDAQEWVATSILRKNTADE